MAPKITRDVLEGYLNCKTKAHLRLAGQQGSVSDYENLLVVDRQEVRQTAIDKILVKQHEGEVVRDISLTAELLPVFWSTSNGSTSQGLDIYQRTTAELPLTSPFLSQAALNSLGVA